MSYYPSSSINRQRSRQLAASAARYAAKAVRRGDTDQGRAAEPTTATPELHRWPEIVAVTEASPISGMAGRYTAKYFGIAINAGGTGNLTAAQLGTSYGECELWHPPDIHDATQSLASTDIVYAFVTHVVGTVRSKPIVVTVGGMGSGLPTPLHLYDVLIAAEKTGGGLQWVSGPPRVYDAG